MNMPAKGTYLRIYSTSANKYVAITDEGSPLTLTGTADNSSVIYYDENGHFVNILNGLGVKDVNSASLTESEWNVFTFAPTETPNSYGKYSIKSDTGVYPFWSVGQTATTVGTSQFGNYSMNEFTLEIADEPVDPTARMRITDAGWATFYAPFAVEIPTGVKAYTGEMQQGWIRMNELTEGYIPASTGVVLELVEGEPFATNMEPMDPQPNAAAVSSCYTGNTTGATMNVSIGDYLLQKQEDVVGWYKVEGEGFTLARNRCYLKESDVPEPNQSRTFIGFAPVDDATGISSIATEAKTKADGKYMVKGQIVVVKAGKAYNMNGTEIK
jgi:hypothetical protein